MPSMCCRCSVWVLDQMMPTIRYGAHNEGDEDQLANRHPVAE